MTAAMRTLLAYSRMNLKYLDSTAYVGNLGSHRVHTRLGFRCKGVGPAVVKWPEVKGGGERRLYSFRLVIGDDGHDPFWSEAGTACEACEAERVKDATTIHT
jgi:RimJ/RimL family protein N-acetyltransferase